MAVLEHVQDSAISPLNFFSRNSKKGPRITTDRTIVEMKLEGWKICQIRKMVTIVETELELTGRKTRNQNH